MKNFKKAIHHIADNNWGVFRLWNLWHRFHLYLIARKNPKLVANNVYKSIFKRDINWENPSNLIEKIYWLQIFSDTSLWSICADKYRIREYLASKKCEWLLPKLYGHWNHANEIDFDTLPNSFVLKTTNGCGQVLLVPDKTKLDINEARKLLERWVHLFYGFDSAQIHYTRIKPTIIAEEFLKDGDNLNKGMTDYKVWCLNGKVVYILCVYDRVILGNRSYQLSAYDTQWNDISESCLKPGHYGGRKVVRPKYLEQMLEYAENLAKDFVEVRVDFYETSERIYLGEMTFSTGYGYHTEDFYERMGEKVDLGLAKRVNKPNKPAISLLFKNEW